MRFAALYMGHFPGTYVFTNREIAMLFEPFVARSLQLNNRIVMAPITRNRAADTNMPNSLMAEYYGQRASAGLIVTEGTSPSPNGLGYARIPGLYNRAHAAAWTEITKTVHDKGGKIFVQLMHTGRVAHIDNLPAGAEVVGPSSAVLSRRDVHRREGHAAASLPRAMTEADIAHAVDEYAHSARLAVEAGFDGVELHGANGYLIEQFLNPNINQRF